MLQKLVAIGGAVEQESFEVQVKARVPSVEHGARGHRGRRDDRRPRRAATTSSTRTGRSTIRTQGRLRYREDEFLDEAGAVTGARARLTLTGRTREEALRRRAALALALSRAGVALGALLPRVLPARPPSTSSRRSGAGGWSRTAASSSTSTSTRLLNPATEGLLPRGQVAHVVAARRARQGRRHHRAARAVRRQPRRHPQRRLRGAGGQDREGPAKAGCHRYQVRLKPDATDSRSD